MKTGNRRKRSEQTRLHLLRTATRLFAERGFHGTGIRDLAEGAGLAISAMYYYAASKDELLDEIMRIGMKRLIDGGREALEDVTGASERLVTIIGLHVAMHMRNPHTTRVVDQEFRSLTGSRKEILVLRDTYEGIWARILADGVASGEFEDRDGVDRFALIEMCTGVAHWYRPDGKLGAEEICRRFGAMGLSLARATARGPVRPERLKVPEFTDLWELVQVDSEPPVRPSSRR